eukprot:TRINITY_DN39047_c0_g1_i1.p1 TRINITY_DN39047_c0_g1~~TRINITY_DN39047_c0_g1_i1.p1  ORF type:complete len:324 (-),score=-5.87 TRINITY_DN39047_c0_g1_i1:631-1602(-)
MSIQANSLRPTKLLQSIQDPVVQLEFKRWVQWWWRDAPVTSTLQTLSLNKREKTCDLCLEPKFVDECISFPCETQSTCRACIRKYVREELAKGRAVIACPNRCNQARCELVGAPLESLCWAEPDLLHLLQQVSVNQGLLSLQDSVGNVVRCPSPDCRMAYWEDGPATASSSSSSSYSQSRQSSSSRQVSLFFQLSRFAFGGADSNRYGERFVCEKCQYASCKVCLLQWTSGAVSHEKMTCEQFARKAPRTAKDRDDMSREAIQRSGAKPCPRCNEHIEKNEGCLHMTCPCGHQFCWVCRREWNADHANYFCREAPLPQRCTVQ